MNNSFVFLLECPFFLLTFQKTLLIGLVEFFFGRGGQILPFVGIVPKILPIFKVHNIYYLSLNFDQNGYPLRHSDVGQIWVAPEFFTLPPVMISEHFLIFGKLLLLV